MRRSAPHEITGDGRAESVPTGKLCSHLERFGVANLKRGSLVARRLGDQPIVIDPIHHSDPGVGVDGHDLVSARSIEDRQPSVDAARTVGRFADSDAGAAGTYDERLVAGEVAVGWSFDFVQHQPSAVGPNLDEEFTRVLGFDSQQAVTGEDDLAGLAIDDATGHVPRRQQPDLLLFARTVLHEQPHGLSRGALAVEVADDGRLLQISGVDTLDRLERGQIDDLNASLPRIPPRYLGSRRPWRP